MKLTYIQNGDYLLPDLGLLEQTRPLGKYGMMRKDYLEQHRPVLFHRLVLSGRLYAHCAEIEEAVENRLGIILPKMMEQYEVTEQLKAEAPMEWTGRMNLCKSQAEEVLRQELIFA